MDDLRWQVGRCRNLRIFRSSNERIRAFGLQISRNRWCGHQDGTVEVGVGTHSLQDEQAQILDIRMARIGSGRGRW